MVVDLAVLHRPDRAVLVREGLMAAGDVDDREASCADRGPRLDTRPESSGPRCCMASFIASSAASEMGRRASPPSWITPQMPHTVSAYGRTRPAARLGARSLDLTSGEDGPTLGVGDHVPYPKSCHGTELFRSIATPSPGRGALRVDADIRRMARARPYFAPCTPDGDRGFLVKHVRVVPAMAVIALVAIVVAASRRSRPLLCDISSASNLEYERRRGRSGASPSARPAAPPRPPRGGVRPQGPASGRRAQSRLPARDEEARPGKHDLVVAFVDRRGHRMARQRAPFVVTPRTRTEMRPGDGTPPTTTSPKPPTTTSPKPPTTTSPKPPTTTTPKPPSTTTPTTPTPPGDTSAPTTPGALVVSTAGQTSVRRHGRPRTTTSGSPATGSHAPVQRRSQSPA